MLLAGDELENTYDFEYTTLDMAWRYPKKPNGVFSLNSKSMLVFILYYRYSVQVCWDDFTYNE